MGIITPDSTYDARLGFNFKLQFIPNTQNYVITDPANVFEAVNIKDNSVSRADCVEFTPIEQTATDKKEGIYYAYAKVTKAADDIRIRPKCALVPKITSVWPPNDNTSYPQDSSIKVSFNKAIKLSDFADENGQLKNITIKTGDTDLLDTTGGKLPYYKSPYLEEDGKTLVIPIVNGNYVITELSETKDIQVDLKLEGLTDGVQEEGVLFNQKEYNFTFRIDSRKDDTPPVLKTLRIARTKDDAENGINLITMDEFTHYAAKENYGGDSTKVAENIQNHHVNKIWIYFEAEDTDSGVGYFEIKEQLIRTTAGGETQAEVFDKTTNGETNCVYNQSENNNYSCCFEYDFKSFEDGVVRLQFYLVDKAGNIYKKTNNKVDEIDLVKDTSCPLEVYLYDPTKKYVDELEDKHNAPYKIELKQKNDTYVYAIDMDGVSYEDTFFTTDENDFSGTVEIESFEYGYDKENMTCIDLQNIEYETESRYSPPNTLYRKKLYVNINVDPYKDVYTKITIKDLAGNINECEDVIPRIVEIASCKVYEEESKIYWSFIFDSNSGRTIALNGYKGSKAISNFYVCTDKTTYKFNRYDSATFPGGSGASGNLNNFDNATYKISAMGVSISSEHYADFYSYGGNFVIFKKDEDAWSVVCNEVTAITENDIPAEDKWRVWEDAAVTNAGTRTIHAEIFNTFVPNQKLQYFIRCEENGNKTYIPVTDFSTPTVFTVPTKYCNYDFSVEVFNQAGSSLESNKVPIDLSYDNIAPVPKGPFGRDIGSSNCFSSFCTMCAYIDDNSEITTLKYYLSNLKNLTSIDWDNIKPVEKAQGIYTNVQNYPYCLFDIVYYEENCPKFIYIYAKDINGNYSIISQSISLEFVKMYPDITVKDSDTSKFKIDCSSVKPTIPGAYSYSFGKSNYYLESNNWVLLENNINGNICETTINKETFIRVQPKVYRGGCTYPVYFYQPYEIAKAKGGNDAWECKLKDLYLGQAGINILADRPCFAHTMYCPRNLGNKEEAWLIGGLETGLMMEDSSFTYSYDNTSGVPAGYYYTTIVHFADGKTLMTPVKQK